MDNVLHIQCIGDIENAQFSGASEYGIVSLSSIMAQVATNPDATEIVVHIHSRGGDVDEGFAIHDFLQNTGKKITTLIEGLCASIATVVALAGSTRKITANSSFFIHNPWSMGIGNADALQQMSDDVRAEEKKLLDFYVAKTGAGADQVQAMMDSETKMPAEQALEMKFVTEIVTETKAKIYAKYNIQNNEAMSKSKVVTQINALLEKFGMKAEQIPAPVAPAPVIKALDLAIEGDAKPLVVETASDAPAVGDMVTYDGNPTPDGTYVMADGSTIKTDAESKISEIIPAAPAAVVAPDVVAQKDAEIVALTEKIADMQTQIDASKTENETIKAEIEDNKKTFATISAKLDMIAKTTVSNYRPDGRDARFRTNQNESVGDVNDAIEKRKAEAKARKMGVKA